MGMYTNVIKVVVSIKSPTDRASNPVRVHPQHNPLPVSSPVKGHQQHNPLPVNNPVKGHQQHNPLPVSNKDNLNQARATGRCNSHTKTGARELRTITGHSSSEAAVPVDPVAVAAGVVEAEAAVADVNLIALHHVMKSFSQNG